MIRRLFCALAFVGLFCAPALAQNEFATPTQGKTVVGFGNLCLNSSAQMVPWFSAAGSWQCAGATLPVSGTFALPSGAATAANQNSTAAGTPATSAQAVQGVPGGVPVPTQGVYPYNVASTQLVRASNSTPYAANETVCLLTSGTVCAPITLSIANVNAGKGIINRVTLLKSGSSTTNASFTIWFYSAAPGTATPNQFDATAYSGPRAADMPNYIGNASCQTGTATSDTTAQVWYECSLSNPNTAGALEFQALSGVTTIDALISVTAAYTPPSAETFNVYMSGFY